MNSAVEIQTCGADEAQRPRPTGFAAEVFEDLERFVVRGKGVLRPPEVTVDRAEVVDGDTRFSELRAGAFTALIADVHRHADNPADAASVADADDIGTAALELLTK